MVWLGIVALLCLVPSIVGVLEQLQTSASQTLLPSPEAAYPWLLALAATSLFSGLGIARRLRGAAAIRRRRFIDGALIGTVADGRCPASIFAGAAIANERAIRETVPTSSRFGPTDPTGQPPLVRRPAGRRADRAPDRDARRRRRPAPDRLDRPRRRPRRHGLPLGRLRRDGPPARARPAPPGIGDRRLGPRARAGRGPPRTRTRRRAAERRPPGARDRARRGQPGDGRGPRRRGHRGRPRAALRVAVDGTTFQAAFPQVQLAGRRRRPRTAGAASSTTGSSWTASSARSSATRTARPRDRGRTRSRPRSNVQLTATERGDDRGHLSSGP